MRKYFTGSIVVFVALLAISPALFAQSSSKQGSGGSATIPDLSGVWEAQGGGRLDRATANATCLAIQSVCAGIFGLPTTPRRRLNVEEPLMLPWAESQYKSVREGVKDPNAPANQAMNPAWGGCMPEGPTEALTMRAFELVQFPDVVLLLFDHDHDVRRIFMDGRGHPQDLKPSWNGHSIGKYDGDALVVDTVGISEKTWIDGEGHPHSDALRVTERLRRANQKSLEVELTFNDPKAYEKPWSKKVVHPLRTPGPQIWDATECEEMLEIGTHYSAESKR